MKNIDTVRREIKQAYNRLKSWRLVASEFGISPGTAYRIAKGYESKQARIRIILGLPAFVKVPVCPRCGKIHLARGCGKEHKPKKWRDMSIRKLRWAFENRVEIKLDGLHE